MRPVGRAADVCLRTVDTAFSRPRNAAVGKKAMSGDAAARPAHEPSPPRDGGPRVRLHRACEKVLDWFRENRYEGAGALRGVVFAAPERHAAGTRDDRPNEVPGAIRDASRRGRRALTDREKIFLTHLSSCAG